MTWGYADHSRSGVTLLRSHVCFMQVDGAHCYRWTLGRDGARWRIQGGPPLGETKSQDGEVRRIRRPDELLVGFNRTIASMIRQVHPLMLYAEDHSTELLELDIVS